MEPLTKYIIASAVSAVIAAQIAHFLVERVFLVHGWVKEVVTDCGTAFSGTLAQQIFALFGVKHTTCTAGHHASNGMAERAIGTFENILAHFVRDTQKNWDSMVAPVEWIMNTTRNDRTGFTPFQLVFGRDPVQPMNLALSFVGCEKIEDFTEYAESVRFWLEKARKVSNLKVNETYSNEAPTFNVKRGDQDFESGDLVSR